MRNYALSPNLLDPQLLDQSHLRMERSARPERADALEILVFKEELDLVLCGLLFG